MNNVLMSKTMMMMMMMMMMMVMMEVVVVVSKLALHHPSPFGHDLANSTSAQSPEVPLGSSECKVKGTCQAPRTLCAGSSASWCNAWPLKVTQVL